MTELKTRKHSRAQWYDYNEGVYFITVCTKGREFYLGNVVNTEMKFSDTGAMLESNIAGISQHHSDVIISQWVVMPNHFHAIVEITPDIPGNVLPDGISAATGCGPTSNLPIVGPQPVAADMPDIYNQPNVPVAADIPNIPQRRFTQKTDRRALLSVVIGGIKAAVTRYANKRGIRFGWQSGFHDRIIRNQREFDLISEYIYNNPARCDKDCFNPLNIIS